MNNVEYEYSVFKSVDAVGDNILLKKLKNDDLAKVNGIYILKSEEYKNMTIGVGQILSISESAKEKFGLKENDYVLYDYYSAHGDWEVNIITNGENILLQITEEEAIKFLNKSLEV